MAYDDILNIVRVINIRLSSDKKHDGLRVTRSSWLYSVNLVTPFGRIRSRSKTGLFRGGTPPIPPNFACFMAFLLPNFSWEKASKQKNIVQPLSSVIPLASQEEKQKRKRASGNQRQKQLLPFSLSFLPSPLHCLCSGRGQFGKGRQMKFGQNGQDFTK